MTLPAPFAVIVSLPLPSDMSPVPFGRFTLTTVPAPAAWVTVVVPKVLPCTEPPA